MGNACNSEKRLIVANNLTNSAEYLGISQCFWSRLCPSKT